MTYEKGEIVTLGENEVILTKPEPKITIEIRPGRWGKIFHLFDADGAEVKFQQKDALRVARQILKESKR